MSSKLNQEELREHSLMNLAQSNKNKKDNVAPMRPRVRTDGAKPNSAHVGKTNANLEGPSDCSNNPMAASEANEEEENFFSLCHKNYHGSIDLGLDEKEVPRGSAAAGGPKPPENIVARVPLSDRPLEEGVSSLTRDFMEKSSVSSQPSKRKECLLRNMNVTQNLPRSLLYPALPPFDPFIISDLEDQARNIATSMDTLIENLTGTLHSISALTVECVETYRDAVCKTCDAVDSNIKSMYQLMAKCEELSKSMKPVYKLHDQIKEIRRLLDLFEGVVFSGGS